MINVDESQHQCDNCGSIWRGSELDPVRDLLERVQPGGVMPSGQCPDQDCQALCYPVDTEESVERGQARVRRRHAGRLYAALANLLEWEAFMGGMDAPAWRKARQLMDRIRDELDRARRVRE